MDKPSASDDSFKAFLEKIQTQNQRGFITQQEIAGEDNDKREKQLDQSNESLIDLKEVTISIGDSLEEKLQDDNDSITEVLEGIKEAVTGIKLDVDFSELKTAIENIGTDVGKDIDSGHLVATISAIGANDNKLQDEQLKEISLVRKLTEGSVEYDKEATQYRNKSGRDIESTVSGKTSKSGGFLDFETARDTLSGQGERARKENKINLITSVTTTRPGKATAEALDPNLRTPTPAIEPVAVPPATPTDSTRIPRPRRRKKEKQEEEAKVDTRGFFETFKDEIKAAPGTIRDNLIGYKSDSKDKKTKIDRAGIEPASVPASVPVASAIDSGTEPVSAPVTAKPQITGVNPESDNIRDSAEIAADYEKEDIELSKQMLGVMREQLTSLKIIQEALAPNVPGPDKSSGPKSPGSKEAAGEGVGGGGGGGDGGGLDLLDALPGKGALKRAGGAVLKGAKTVGKGALSLGGSVAKFAGSGAGKLLGATAAVGMGAYTAYTGVTEAEDSKQAKLEEVQAKVESGELKPEEAAAQRKEIGNSATVEKSGAVGEGSGMAAGAIAGGMAGAKLGAVIGSVIPGAGTVVGAGIGTIAGGALGAFAGSSAGKFVGEKVGSGINAVKGFFGGSTDAPGAATKEALAPTPATVKSEIVTTTDSQFSESEFGKKDPDTFKKYQEFKDKRTEEIARKDPFFKTDPQSAYTVAKVEAEKEARAKFKKEIEAAGAGEIKTKTEEKVTGGPGAKDPVTAGAAALPIVEKKPVDTAAPGKATAVAPIETVDGKKVKPVTDVDKAQQAAKEKYQASKLEEKAASEKIKEFEKANPFDIKSKGEIETGNYTPAKFSDAKKQKEYDTLSDASYKASKATSAAGAEYTAAEGVTKTQEFTGGVQPSRPGAKNRFDSMQSDGAKIQALQKRGYTDKDLGRDDTLTTNYIKDDEGKKYPIRNLGLYEAVVKKELEAPTKTKDGQVVPKETVDGKSAIDTKGATPNSSAAFDKEFEAANADQDATEKHARNLDEIAMAEAKKGGRATPDINDRRAAQQIARREALKTAGPNVTEGTIKGLEVTPEGMLKGGKVSKAGQEVTKTTTENTDMEREASRSGGNNNTIVSNNVNNNNTTKFVPMKPTARPEYTGSALDRHANRISVY